MEGRLHSTAIPRNHPLLVWLYVAFARCLSASLCPLVGPAMAGESLSDLALAWHEYKYCNRRVRMPPTVLATELTNWSGRLILGCVDYVLKPEFFAGAKVRPPPPACFAHTQRNFKRYFATMWQ